MLVSVAHILLDGLMVRYLSYPEKKTFVLWGNLGTYVRTYAAVFRAIPRREGETLQLFFPHRLFIHFRCAFPTAYIFLGTFPAVTTSYIRMIRR